MSHFIAHTISFSKDFKTFRVKGGDNNLVPRSNSWSNDIPIDKLYYNLNGGMIKLTGTSEKNAFIRFLVDDMDFGGDWQAETDYYHMKNKNDYDNPIPEVQEFDHRFTTRLINGLKEISDEKGYVIYFHDNTYIRKANPTHAKLTRYRENAQKFSYYRGIEVFKIYEHKGAKFI